MSDYDRGWCAAMERLDDDPAQYGFISESLVRGMLNEIREKAINEAYRLSHPELADIPQLCDEYIEAIEDSDALLALGVRWSEKLKNEQSK